MDLPICSRCVFISHEAYQIEKKIQKIKEIYTLRNVASYDLEKGLSC